jgi:nitrous oxidase accessory protein NosD
MDDPATGRTGAAGRDAAVRAAALATLLALALVVTAVVGSASASSGSPRELLVDDDGAQCPSTPYRHIQDALDRAPAGGRVVVCPGRYDEQVRISRPVTLAAQAAAVDQTECFDPDPASPDPTTFAVVRRPDSSTTGATVEIRADDARVSGLVIEGATGVAGEFFDAGIAVAGSTSGQRIDHNVIRLNSLGVDLASNGYAESRVDHNCVRENGWGLASQTAPLIGARVDHNETYDNAVNAFEIGWHVAPVVSTTFDHNRSRADGGDAYRLENTTEVTLSHNRVEAVARAIAVVGGNASTAISHNELSGGTGSGVQFMPPTPDVPQLSTLAEVSHNTITGFGDPAARTGIGIGVAQNGAGVGSLIGGLIEHNDLSRNGLVGISVQPFNPGLRVRHNSSNDNGSYGIYARPGSTGVLFEANRMVDNGLYDVRDDGIANIWLRNTCETSSPAGLCGAG